MNNRIDKPFKTIDQQISILQSRNLLFHNKENDNNFMSKFMRKIKIRKGVK